MVQGHVGVLLADFGDHVLPQLEGFEHIGLVHAGHALATLLRGLEGDVGDALDLGTGVAHGVEGFLGAGEVAIGGHAAAARLAEVDVAGQLADDEDVEARDQFGLEAGGVGQFLVADGGTEVGEQAQGLAQAENGLLGAQRAVQRVVLPVAHGAEQERDPADPPHLDERQSRILLQVTGQPEETEIPDRVADETDEQHAPQRARLPEPAPREGFAVVPVGGAFAERDVEYLFGRVGAQSLHQVLHGVHAGFALKSKAAQGVAVIAKLFVQRFNGIQQRHALLGIPGGGFTHQQRGVYGILIPHMSAGQVTIALLKAKDIAFHMALCFQLADLLADELKARQSAAQLHAVLFGNRRCHIGGNNGGHGHGSLGHGAAGQACAADIIQQDNAHLVAGDQPVAALAVRHSGAAAVTVGVGAKQ